MTVWPSIVPRVGHFNSAFKKVLPGINDDGSAVAVGQFTNEQQQNGWTKLEINSNSKFDDASQAMAAGIAEGYLTRQDIVLHYLT